jgi:hypothetical protein
MAQKTAHLQIPQDRLADFCRRHHIRWLALFGSVLRDDFGPDSDVDILVDFEPEARIGLLAFARIQRELSELLQRPVDLVTRDGLKWVIRQAVLDSAEVIYDAEREVISG